MSLDLRLSGGRFLVGGSGSSGHRVSGGGGFFFGMSLV